MDKLLNKVPNQAPDGPLGTDKKGPSPIPPPFPSPPFLTPTPPSSNFQKGPLSALGDPLGNLLSYTLAPLGHVTKAIGNPHGEALMEVRRTAEFEGIGKGGEGKFLKSFDDDDGRGKKNGKGVDDVDDDGKEGKGEGEGFGGKEQTGENHLGL